jgi:hypothetical protein
LLKEGDDKLSNRVTALTCTGDRPICLKLLADWINRQSLKVDQWLIIDDGRVPFVPSMNCDYIYRTPQHDDPEQTLNTNIEYAIPFITGDVILFCEDDEFYSKDYVKTMVEKIQGHEAVGICKSKYYNLPFRTYYVHNTRDHASLAQTGIVKEYLPTLKTLLVGDPFIDIRIWEEIGGKDLSWKKMPFIHNELIVGNGRGILFDDGMKDCLYVGMKGMPGRKGIGAGHKGAGRSDSRCGVLREWMPQDYQTYMNLQLSVNRHEANPRRI